MRNVFLARAAAISLLALPVALSAQETAPDTTSDQATPGQTASSPDASTMSTPADSSPSMPMAPYKMDASQQTTYQSWPEQQRADYDAWPSDYKAYYWSLNSQQQQGYWAMTPDQRGMIYKMSPDQRAKAWQSVAAQLNGQTPPTPAGQANPPGTGMPTDKVPDPSMAAQSVPPAMPQDPGYQGGPYKGALTPPPATAMNKDYPVCSRKVQDSCRNRGGV